MNATEAEEPSEAPHSAWHEIRDTFAERAINFRTLPASLRLAVGAAYAQILVAVLLIAVREFGLKDSALVTLTIQGASLPALSYDVVLVALLLGTATLLTGAFLAHPLVRILVLVLFTEFCRSLAPYDVSWLFVLVPLSGLWIAFGVSLFRKPTSFGKTFVPLLMCVASIGVAAFAGVFSPSEFSPLIRFGAAVTTAISELVFILGIVLVIAGGELGDWSQLAGAGIGATLTRIPGARIRAIVVAIGAIVFLEVVIAPLQVWQIPRIVLVVEASLIAFAGCVIAVIAFSVRRFGTPRIIHIPWFALAAASALYLIPFSVGPAVGQMHTSRNPDFLHFTSTENRTPFSIDIPTVWKEIDYGTGSAQGAYFSDGEHGGAGFALIAFPGPENRVPSAEWVLNAEEHPSKVTFVRKRGDTLEFRANEPSSLKRIDVVRKYEDGYTWQFEQRASPATFDSQRATFAEMLRSFKAGEEAIPMFDASGAIGDVLMILVGGIALITLLRRFTVSAVFLALFSTIYLAQNFQHLVAVILHRQAVVIPLVRYPTIEVAAIVCILALLAILAIRRHPAFDRATVVLGSALAGLVTLHILFGLYAAAIKAGELSLAQAAIVLLALSWDIVMSGESITNGDSRAFPRPARLGMFLGYVMLVAAVILFFASAKTTNGTPISSFESEGLVRFGILAIGLPLLLTAFITRLIVLFVASKTVHETSPSNPQSETPLPPKIVLSTPQSEAPLPPTTLRSTSQSVSPFAAAATSLAVAPVATAESTPGISLNAVPEERALEVPVQQAATAVDCAVSKQSDIVAMQPIVAAEKSNDVHDAPPQIAPGVSDAVHEPQAAQSPAIARPPIDDTAVERDRAEPDPP